MSFGKHKAAEDAGGYPTDLKKRRTQTPTVKEIIRDSLTQLSLKYWAPLTQEEKTQNVKRLEEFNPQIIEDIYSKELVDKTDNGKLDLQKIVLLELSHYLENYLWKFFDPRKATFAHLMSILVLVNDKFRENVSAWDAFASRSADFPAFFERVLGLPKQQAMTPIERNTFIVFLINSFQSLEDPMVRKHCLSICSLRMWHSLTPVRLENELKAFPKVARHWAHLEEKGAEPGSEHERYFLYNLLQEFLGIVESVKSVEDMRGEKVWTLRYCERVLELVLDLLSQLPTRRFFHAVVQDVHLIVRCQMSTMAGFEETRLFNQLLEMVNFYDDFEIDDMTGLPLTEAEMIERHTERIHRLQRIAFKHFHPALKPISLGSISTVDKREFLQREFEHLSTEQMRELAALCGLVPPPGNDKEGDAMRVDGPSANGHSKESTIYSNREFLLEILVSAHAARRSQLEAINDMPVYPTEDILWDDKVIPSSEYTGDYPLALPKLNLQFLTFYDYLLRNYDLFRLEASYEMRESIEDALSRLNPRRDDRGVVSFTGWSKMAAVIEEFAVVHVGKPRLGEEKPSEVIAEVQYDLTQYKQQHTRDEWDQLRLHDVVFMVSIQPSLYINEQASSDKPFPERYGLKYVRGAEVVELKDEDGHPIRDFEVEKSKRSGTKRTLKLRLDASQYQGDMAGKDEDVYGAFNVLLRRKAKENNFKAVLETIKELINTKVVVPDWLHDIFLGFGDPSAATLMDQQPTLDFCDTFLNVDHLVSSFPGHNFRFLDEEGNEKKKEELLPPFKVTFPVQPKAKEGKKTRSAASTTDKTLTVRAYKPPAKSPYPQLQPKSNSVPFTPVQVQAIRSGLCEGLTMVVGPPGTGKTDCAVQMISNIYHNFPQQRTLIVTHSNQALNQLFEKIMALDIDERHLIRLGHGEEQLETEKDFSKYGRVNYMLERRLQLLSEVERLATSLRLQEAYSYTCESAEFLYQEQVHPRWTEFKTRLDAEKAQNKGKAPSDAVARLFPFVHYFSTAPQPLFVSEYEKDWAMAQTCHRHITSIFTELREMRAFELLRSPSDRANYLLTRQAKIVAMTCTHAAIKRQELVRLGFRYDNLVMEESAQILEIETFIPMLLQDYEQQEGCRLKRVVLIGDHNQLPPVVKNLAFQKYSHLDQSLYTRFVRLGVPTIQLDAQGRARSEIANLYRWRYKNLQDLTITQHTRFQFANPGFAFTYQFINIDDYQGRGESQPNPFFYQNLGEAEYAVGLFMYMRLMGYPASSITILTTYNGQKHLIRDVIESRCAKVPFIGRPSKVTTVDRFQGQQNDFIILSLVRTNAVGHLRDVRRLVVAMSRARLGLYIVGRQSLFENCYELTPTFSQLIQRPNKLQIVPAETYPPTRPITQTVVGLPIEDVVHLGAVVADMQTKAAIEYELERQRRQEEAQRIMIENQRKAEEEAERAKEEEREAQQQHLQRLKRKAEGTEGEDMEEVESDSESDGDKMAT